MRTSISKKLRFEIFKRDSFKCQYCGKEAPNVILEVDHITPVSKGGKNDILNLITCCFDCNRGKGKRLLKDNETLKKQKEQLNLLQKKREQIEMMVQWKNELNDIENYLAKNIANRFFEQTNIQFSYKALTTIKKAIDNTSYEIVFDVYNLIMSELTDFENIDIDTIANIISKRASYRQFIIDNPYMKDVFYLRKILINAYRIPKTDYKTLTMLKNRIENALKSVYNTDEYDGLVERAKIEFATNNTLQESYDYLSDYDPTSYEGTYNG